MLARVQTRDPMHDEPQRQINLMKQWFGKRAEMLDDCIQYLEVIVDTVPHNETMRSKLSALRTLRQEMREMEAADIVRVVHQPRG